MCESAKRKGHSSLSAAAHLVFAAPSSFSPLLTLTLLPFSLTLLPLISKLIYTYFC